MEKEDELKRLGHKVKAFRLGKRMSQTELANNIGKDQPSINRLERGNVNPSYVFLLEISKGLGVTISELLDF